MPFMFSFCFMLMAKHLKFLLFMFSFCFTLMMKQFYSLMLSLLLMSIVSLSQSSLDVPHLLLCYLLLGKQVTSQLFSLCLLCIQCTLVLDFHLCFKIYYMLMKLSIGLPRLIIVIGICSWSRHWNLCLSIMLLSPNGTI